MCTRWDFSKGKVLNRWSELNKWSDAGVVEGGPQLFNPPMVRQVALADTVTENRAWASLAAAAVGDGSVVVFDAEDEAASSSSNAGAKTGGKKGAKKAAVEDGRCPALDVVLPGLRFGIDGTAGGHTSAASCCCFVPGSLEDSDLGYDAAKSKQDRQQRGEGANDANIVIGFSEMMLVTGGDDRR